MSQSDADGMANSVDPDQTAPLGKRRIITVHVILRYQIFLLIFAKKFFLNYGSVRGKIFE